MTQPPKDNNSNCKCSKYPSRSGLTPRGLLILIVVGVAVVVGIVAVWSIDFRGEGGSGLADKFDYGRVRPFDEALLQWEATSGMRSPLHRPSGVAYRDGRIYLVNKEAVSILSRSGTQLKQFQLNEPGRRIDVDSAGTIYVTHPQKVTLLSQEGDILGTWSAPSPKSSLLSVAVVDDLVAVSDLGLRAVHVYDREGTLQGEITKPEKGFELPSDNFELADTPDGLLLVADSGSKKGLPRIEAYDPRTRNRIYGWGEKGEDIVRFNGCCNPTGIAVLPDGRVVTTEKTLVTIKVFTSRRDGSLSSVVAGPEQLNEHTPWDVAIDEDGNLIVLFTDISMLRIFSPADQESAS